jgi:hypothetical protein
MRRSYRIIKEAVNKYRIEKRKYWFFWGKPKFNKPHLFNNLDNAIEKLIAEDPNCNIDYETS